MICRRIGFLLRILCAFVSLTAFGMAAVEMQHQGQVTFNGQPVPGATVTAVQGGKQFVTVTDLQGDYALPLSEGDSTLQVQMLGFEASKQTVHVVAGAPVLLWELKLLSLEQITVLNKPVIVQPGATPKLANTAPMPKGESAKPQAETGPQSESAETQSADGLLINGSVNNAATSKFSLAAAFGNHRSSGKGLYTGSIGVVIDNSAFDARPYSLTGLDTPKASYSRVTSLLTLGGPIKIPHLLRNGPNFFIGYQWTRDRDATTQSALVPDQAERNGDFSGLATPIFNPITGLPFANNRVPVSPQALVLLKFYPLPNLAGSSRYNYQTPILSNDHEDALQSRLDKTLGHRDEVYGRFAFQSTRTSGSNLFGFLDTTDVLGLNTALNWSHRFNHRLSLNTAYKFSRLRTDVKPFFENRVNVSQDAGITDNNQDPTNWGPPTLAFSSGIASLSDAQSSFNRNRTDGYSASAQWDRGRHNVTAGFDFRRQGYNNLSQQNPRGTFTFTGAATQGAAANSGSDLADLLLGVPDTSSIAFGNADKYLRQSAYDAYVTDDWRILPQLTFNVGVRWEYGSPITELHGRLVNLDIAPGFASVAPVLASAPVGSLTGEQFPSSLIRPDKQGVEPRLGLSWRPIPGSSMVVRAGYGVYDDTSVYQTSALQLAQQSPLSKSLSVQNSADCQLTLANGFNPCSSITSNTFAVDPNFRVGYAQTWQLAVQRDLPGSMQMTATYLGIKGTRGQQEFLPNTYPVGALNPCPSCPTGFVFLTSNGNSTRESGSLQLRRRLRSGFTATVQYTFAKAVDNDSVPGGQGATTPTSITSANPFAASSNAAPSNPSIAQNWLDLSAERGRSSFDQRHLVNVQAQYTSGMGLGGGTLLQGWRGALLKEWSIVTQINFGTGLPETPIYLVAVPGTGVTGTIRPNVTGAPLSMASAGLFLNPAAYAAPQAGQWGDAGRNSITGPSQFTLNASLGRVFRLDNRLNLDVRLDATNMLNHVTFTDYDTTINSTQFGLPAAANAMRTLQITSRLRF